MNNIKLNDLPYEILSKIYNYACIDNTPLFNYRIRFINQDFKKIVDNHKGAIGNYLDDTDLDKIILYNIGHINTYEWLYNHKIYMKYTDILHLINNNRIDVLNLAVKYKNNTNILFNRFYLTDGYANERLNIFNLGIVGRSFFLSACEIGNLEIVKFFLESSKSIIYVIQIGAAIEICCDNHKLEIIEYLYKNHIDKCRYNIESKLLRCIKVFGEGLYNLLIYLIKNEKIELTNKLKNTDIIKNITNELFR